MPEPIIRLRQISKSFGKKLVLDQVDLDLYPNQALCIIGPSGTGKSTILRIIAGLLAPDEGEIYIQGQHREGLIEENKDPIGIGMVFQQSALFDSLTVEENVGFWLYEHSKLSRSRIRELVHERLEMVGLSDVGNLYPSELSGGMRKRVSFARAIIYDPDNPDSAPKVLLYDEPTAGLDPIVSTRIEELVRKLQCSQRGVSSYVMVTHQQSTIRNTADRVIFLHEGKVQWQGDVKEIDTTDNHFIRQFFSGSTEGPIKVG